MKHETPLAVRLAVIVGSMSLGLVAQAADRASSPKGNNDRPWPPGFPHNAQAEVDTRILNNAPQTPAVQEMFAVARTALAADPQASFANTAAIREVAERHGITHLGGPMLGGLASDGARVWVRTVRPAPVTVVVQTPAGERGFGPVASAAASDLTAVVPVTGLVPGTRHPYRVLVDGQPITMPTDAAITTAPGPAARLRLAFGADFHKVGLWNRRLLDQIRSRGNAALLLLGDLAVDDRDNHVGLHRSDYLLRDLSPGWQELVATVPVYATWDDHDYFNNDKSGIPPGFTEADRAAVRTVWRQSWNNPSCGFEDRGEGIFFRTRIGPCDVIMLDTRFFRNNSTDGDRFLGRDQMQWLLDQLATCTGPFIILTGGTMWSDAISNGKDSWGAKDREGRERLFALIEKQRIGGVLLLSGDRHGARVVRLPQPSGFAFHEFEMGSLGGHKIASSSPMGDQPEAVLFGLLDVPAFGEFIFDTTGTEPTVEVRVVDATGKELFQQAFTRSQLTPP